MLAGGCLVAAWPAAALAKVMLSGPVNPMAAGVASASVESVSGGDFVCSELIPGVIPNPEGAAPPGTCNEAVVLDNTDSGSDSFDLTLGQPSGTTSALQALNQLLVTYPAAGGTVSVSYAALTQSAQPLHLAALGVGQSVTLTFAVSLVGGITGAAANAWNGATVQLPYTVAESVANPGPSPAGGVSGISFSPSPSPTGGVLGVSTPSTGAGPTPTGSLILIALGMVLLLIGASGVGWASRSRRRIP